MNTTNEDIAYPLITIVTIVYNGEKYLQECIDSIQNQTYKHIEYIVIDGGSNDRTLEIIKSNEKVIDSWISESDNGISDAFNKGINRANGEIIGILNCDDLYNEFTIQELANSYLKNDRSEGVYYGDIRYFGDDQSYELVPRIKNIWKYMSIYHPATFVCKSVYQNFGVFSEDFKYAMDVELLHRFLHKGVPFIYIPKTLTNFRLEGTSDIHYKKSYREFYESVKMYNPKVNAKFYYYYGVAKKTILRTSLGNFIRKKRKLLAPFLSGKFK